MSYLILVRHGQSVWNDLIEKKELYGFESSNEFHHLTDFETFKKLQDL